jgi:hypothetical protein
MGANLPSRDGGGGTCPVYEFIGIPYNGWGCKSPFVADVLDIDIVGLMWAWPKLIFNNSQC